MNRMWGYKPEEARVAPAWVVRKTTLLLDYDEKMEAKSGR